MECQWDVISWWLSGCLLTDLWIHLDNLSFLCGICRWFWQLLWKSHLSLCIMLHTRTWRCLRSMHFALIPLFLFRTHGLFCLTSTEMALSLDLELTAWCPEPTSCLERGLHVMCPVHFPAYLSSRHDMFPCAKQIFVSPLGWGKGSLPYTKALEKLLSHWSYSLCLLQCGREQEILCANPHFMWVMTTSWAKIEYRPRKSVMRLPGRHVYFLLVGVFQWLFLKRLHMPDQATTNAETPFLLSFSSLPYLDLCRYQLATRVLVSPYHTCGIKVGFFSSQTHCTL